MDIDILYNRLIFHEFIFSEKIDVRYIFVQFCNKWKPEDGHFLIFGQEKGDEAVIVHCSRVFGFFRAKRRFFLIDCIRKLNAIH